MLRNFRTSRSEPSALYLIRASGLIGGSLAIMTIFGMCFFGAQFTWQKFAAFLLLSVASPLLWLGKKRGPAVTVGAAMISLWLVDLVHHFLRSGSLWDGTSPQSSHPVLGLAILAWALPIRRSIGGSTALLAMGFATFGALPFRTPFAANSEFHFLSWNFVQAAAVAHLYFAVVFRCWYESRGRWGEVPTWLINSTTATFAITTIGAWQYSLVAGKVGFIAGGLRSPMTDPVGPVSPHALLGLRTLFGALLFGAFYLARHSWIQSKRTTFLNRKLVVQSEHRRKTLSLLRTAQREADEANRAKTWFLTSMSHEIRNPLNVILGMTQLLRREPLGAPADRYLRSIRLAGDQLLGLVSNILDFSEIERGKVRLEIQDTNVRRLLESVVEMFEVSAAERNIKLQSTCSENFPALLKTDPLRIKQIAINLIGNALKFTQAGSVRINISGAIESSRQFRLVLTVTDTGPGIAREIQDRLFREFSQGSAKAVAQDQRGSGLGLSITRNLARRLGGSVHFSSQVGRGSEFWVELPMQLGAQLETEPVTKDVSLFNVSILVVDDEEMNREVARHHLHLAGARVTCLSDGKELLKLSDPEISRYDILLLDNRMPEVGGIEAARHLRHRSLEIPILAVTASATVDEQDLCLKAGMNAVLTKPYSPQDLARKIAQMIRRNEDLSQAPDFRQIFVRSMEAGLRELHSAIAKGNTEAVANVAHRLRSTVGFMGFSEMSAICEQLESQAEAVKSQDLLVLIGNLELEFKKYLAVSSTTSAA